MSTRRICIAILGFRRRRLEPRSERLHQLYWLKTGNGKLAKEKPAM